MSWRGWLFAVGLVLLLGWLMFESGWFMHGDCIDINDAPPCS